MTTSPVTYLDARRGRETEGAFAGFACRTLTTMRTTDTHMARIDAAYAPTTPRETDEMPEEGDQ